MLRLKKIFVITALICLAGCAATPDLSGWADNSAELAGAIAAEQKEVLGTIDDTIVQIKIGTTEKWPNAGPGKSFNLKKWQDGDKTLPKTSAAHLGYRKTYSNASDTINGTLEVMVRYANALASLAAAGETGKEASDKLLSSTSNILNTVGQTFPVTASLSAFLGELSGIITKVQAQDTLAETMQDTQPFVQRLAQEIDVLTSIQARIVTDIDGTRRSLAESAFGTNRLDWFRNNDSYAEIEKAFGSDSITVIAARLAILERLESGHRLYQTEVVEIKQWKDARIKALKLIAVAADEWEKSHRKAAEYLIECGGLRSLNSSCGNFTAANIKLAAKRIEAVVSSLNPDE